MTSPGNMRGLIKLELGRGGVQNIEEHSIKLTYSDKQRNRRVALLPVDTYKVSTRTSGNKNIRPDEGEESKINDKQNLKEFLSSMNESFGTIDVSEDPENK